MHVTSKWQPDQKSIIMNSLTLLWPTSSYFAAVLLLAAESGITTRVFNDLIDDFTKSDFKSF
jgi:hypothetical protein